MEEWKDIGGYEGLYQVSNYGRVAAMRGWCIMTEHEASNGYKRLHLFADGKHKNFSPHRLVALAFIPNGDGLQVNHKDGDKTNNHVDNLEWVTASDNMKHAHANGLVKMPAGEKHWNNKLTESRVIMLRLMNKMGATYLEMSKNLGINVWTIADACNGRTWKHVI